MIGNKTEFIKTFLPSKIEKADYASIDLDISDLSIADILRNINRQYPINSRIRNAISSGTMAMAVLCKTETLDPLSGILLIITDDENKIDLVSKNHLIFSIPEHKIVDDESIKLVIDSITKCLIKGFRDTLTHFNDFYIKFVYDPYENEENDED